MRFKRVTNTGYVWDSRVFMLSLLATIVLACVIADSYDWNFSMRATFVCDSQLGAPCLNPLYWADEGKVCYDAKGLDCVPLDEDFKCLEDWCSQKYLEPGTYGPVQSPLFKAYPYWVTLFFLLAIPLNHLFHNRGKKFDLGLREYYEKEAPWLLKAMDKMGEVEDDETH